MNPEIAQLQAQVAELLAWKKARETQAIPYPLDDASRNSLSVPVGGGKGSSTLTTTITIGAGGGSATVPIGYAGSFILTNVDGVSYEIGYIRTI